MLVLTRKAGQKIVLPELGITIKVIQTGKGSSKIGIEADSSIRIVRGEILTAQPQEEPHAHAEATQLTIG